MHKHSGGEEQQPPHLPEIQAPSSRTLRSVDLFLPQSRGRGDGASTCIMHGPAERRRLWHRAGSSRGLPGAVCQTEPGALDQPPQPTTSAPSCSFSNYIYPCSLETLFPQRELAEELMVIGCRYISPPFPPPFTTPFLSNRPDFSKYEK